MLVMGWTVMTVECFGHYSALVIIAGVSILKMAQRFPVPGLIVTKHAGYLTALT